MVLNGCGFKQSTYRMMMMVMTKTKCSVYLSVYKKYLVLLTNNAFFSICLIRYHYRFLSSFSSWRSSSARPAPISAVSWVFCPRRSCRRPTHRSRQAG